MAGHFRNLPSVAKCFPEGQPQFAGFMKPSRFEGTVDNLEIIGEIPAEIDGTFYRVMPDPHLPPMYPDDPWFNGDGNISAFRIKDGHVDFKQRYVRTEKFVKEAEARRALLGRYRNRYTDAIKFAVRSTANTNIVYFRGMLLACKEDSPPYAMNPDTLETIGLWDFDGQLQSPTFTAHPKFDPVTREMVCFGYEARGDGTPDVCYWTVHPDGKLGEAVWTVAPVCGMIHDFAVTQNYCVFPIIPLTCDADRLKQGGEHWQWDSTIPIYIGVIPRRGATGSDIKWFRAPNGFPGHVANAYEDASGKIVLDLPISTQNVFFWWPDAEGKAPVPQTITSSLSRFTIDPHSHELDLANGEILLGADVEFPRIDDRFAMAKHQTTFMCEMDPRLGTDFPYIGRVMGGGFPPYNSLAKFDVATGKHEVYFPGPRYLVQECVFIPRKGSAREADGYVMALMNNYDEMVSELCVLDTNNFSQRVALVKLPLHLRAGLHGNWVDAADVDGHPDALVGTTNGTSGTNGANGANGANGTNGHHGNHGQAEHNGHT